MEGCIFHSVGSKFLAQTTTESVHKETSPLPCPHPDSFTGQVEDLPEFLSEFMLFVDFYPSQSLTTQGKVNFMLFHLSEKAACWVIPYLKKNSPSPPINNVEIPEEFL
uniref:SIRH12 n=1 Tax=Notamacropus eugenii TaxID=9315 RepID=G9CU09_NOTEU|nr:SIRH12 [Notamacropus eugenii]AEW43886.1 SIRH12 [Notamacropus eugenii]